MGKLCTALCTQLHSCSTGKEIFPWQECRVGSWCPQAAGTAPPALLLPHPTSAPTQPQPGMPWNEGSNCAGMGGHREGINAPRTLCTSSALTLCAQTTCKGTSGAHPTLGLLPLGCGELLLCSLILGQGQCLAQGLEVHISSSDVNLPSSNNSSSLLTQFS